MGRKRLNPEYNPEKIQKEMIEICRDLCIGSGTNASEGSDDKKQSPVSLRCAANELGISVSKVIKLLITGGYYSTDISEKINELYEKGKTVPEIQEVLNVSRATVQAYLPYKKGIYNAKDISLNAERIRVFRDRKKSVERLKDAMKEDALWDAVVAFQKYPFHTASGLPFT